jgi:hypothetical protein
MSEKYAKVAVQISCPNLASFEKKCHDERGATIEGSRIDK